MSGVKTFSNETSERYALALFELANENSEVEVVEKNIILLSEILNQNLEFANSNWVLNLFIKTNLETNSDLHIPEFVFTMSTPKVPQPCPQAHVPIVNKILECAHPKLFQIFEQTYSK